MVQHPLFYSWGGPGGKCPPGPKPEGRGIARAEAIAVAAQRGTSALPTTSQRFRGCVDFQKFRFQIRAGPNITRPAGP